MVDNEIIEINSEMCKWADTSTTDNLSTKSLSNLSLHGVDEKSEVDDTDNCDYTNIYIGSVDNTELDSLSKQVEEMDISADVLSSERSSPKETENISPKNDEVNDITYKQVNIGTFIDQAVPLEYCSRLIAKSFLLTGSPFTLIPDKNVRISVKSLALICISHIVEYYPEILIFYLDKSDAKSDEAKSDDVKQRISDVLLFSEHSDPQLRGNTICLIGNFVKAVLTYTQKNYSKWLQENSDDSSLVLDNLMKLFIKVRTFF